MKTSIYGFLIVINFIVALTLLSINTHAAARNNDDSIELTGP